MNLSVIIPAHNPDPGRLQRTLQGLHAQTLPAAAWEVLLVDNASNRFPDADFLAGSRLGNLSIIAEPELGLTAARRRGLAMAQGDLAVLVDDDNVLAPDYLAEVTALFAAHPRLGAAGGKSRPEFAAEPAGWVREFFPLLALRDLGDSPLLATGLRPAGATHNEYPAFAPIGAGMTLRRAAWESWLQSASTTGLSDRRGTALTSGGDNEIIFRVLEAGWTVGYFPGLALTHLIPAGRLEPDYLARLNRGIQESWMQVLALHDANPWPPLSLPGVVLRQMRAWFSYRAWSSPSARIRWQGACGHFAGRRVLRPARHER